MHYLRQNSGTSGGSGDTVTLGPCLDSAGAEYTGLVIGDLTITKNGTSAAMAANATLTHTSNGFYDLVMIGNNADTLGKLTIRCNKSGYQIPPAKYIVLTAMVYDSWVAGSDKLEVDAVQFGGTNGTFSGGRPEVNAVSLPAIPNNWITSAGINNAALTSAKFASDAIDNNALAASAVAEIWASVADSAGVTTLLSRLSSARAGYLDNINNSSLASVPAFPSNFSSLGIEADGMAHADLKEWKGAVPADYSTTRGTAGTALPAVAAEAAGGLFTRGSGAGQLMQSQNGSIDINVTRWQGATSTCGNLTIVFSTDFAANYDTTLDRWKTDVQSLGGSNQSLTDLKDFADDGYDPSTNKVQGVVLTDTATNLTNLPTMPTDWLTSTGLAASAVAEIWASQSDSSGVTTLLSRLSSTRAGYLDNLSGGAVAIASAVASLQAILQADEKIDSGQTPWEKVYLQSGTATELFRKRLLTVAGGNITSTDDVIGQSLA